MKVYTIIVLAILILFTAIAPGEADSKSSYNAGNTPDELLVFLPEDIEWQNAPPSLERGAKFALLEGDPSEDELFTMYLKMPDGYHIAPHWHPNIERVTVISGVYQVGYGKNADRGSAISLGQGSYSSMPCKKVHYVYAYGETIVQLTTTGPWEINYTDPVNDPRLSKKY